MDRVPQHLSHFDQRALAWALAEVARPHLMPEQRLWLCALIGAGELETALTALLDCCAVRRLILPDHISELVRGWLAGYAGTRVGTRFGAYPGVAIPT